MFDFWEIHSSKTVLPYENMHAATNFDNAQKNCLFLGIVYTITDKLLIGIKIKKLPISN